MITYDQRFIGLWWFCSVQMDFDEDAVFDADLSSGQGLLTETDDSKRRRSEPATSELRRDENEQVPERPTGELIAGARIGESE